MKGWWLLDWRPTWKKMNSTAGYNMVSEKGLIWWPVIIDVKGQEKPSKATLQTEITHPWQGNWNEDYDKRMSTGIGSQIYKIGYMNLRSQFRQQVSICLLSYPSLLSLLLLSVLCMFCMFDGKYLVWLVMQQVWYLFLALETCYLTWVSWGIRRGMDLFLNLWRGTTL